MKKKRYSAEFKLKAVKLFEKGRKAEEIGEGFKISPKSLYAWAKRYKKEGYKGLENRKGGYATGTKSEQAAIIKKVVEVKKQNPGMGTGKISGHIARFNFLKICSSTVKKILNKHAKETIEASNSNPDISQTAEVNGRILQARKKKKKINKPKQIRYFERSSPNTLWQMDIMTFMLKGMYRIYLIGIIDDYSRYIVSHGLYRRQTENNVHEVVRSAIEKHGCPKEILTDNGRQFYSWRGKSKFTKFCIKTGIQHIRSRPYHPQTLGKIESFWRNLYQEFLGEVPLSSFEEAQEKIAKWIKYYNHERVHLGIGGHLVPADRYFGVSKQVEQLIKEGSDENEKELSINPLSLKPPMYLIGKIGDKEIRVLAKDGEMTISDGTEKAVEEGGKNIIKLTEESITESVVISPVTTELGEDSNDTGTRTAGATGTFDESRGQVSPPDKCAGENGTDTVGIIEGKNSTADMSGPEHQQGSILQMDAGSDDCNEGVTGACRPGQESEARPCIETGERIPEKEERETSERKIEIGVTSADPETVDNMAETG